MAFADIIAANRRIDWTVGVNVGIRGGIPYRESIYTTLYPGATLTEINAALTAAGSGQVVLLAPGVFNVSGGNINIPSNKTLRGSGRSLTTLIGSTIRMTGGYQVATAVDITAGFTQNNTVITVSDASGIVAGDFLSIYQDNESWVFDRHSAGTKIYGIYRVESKDGSDLTIWPPLRYGSTGFNPKAARKTSAMRENASLESMTIQSNTAFDIMLEGCYSCWVKDVLSPLIADNGCYVSHSVGCEIVKYDVLDCSSESDGYGIRLAATDKGNNAHAVYDSFLAHCRHAVMTSGQHGCYFGYIATFHEADRSYLSIQQGGINISHGAEGMMTLWEGSCANYLEADRIHGGAAYQTLFRNRFTGVSSFQTLKRSATIVANMGSYRWNTVGNVLGDAWATNHGASIVYEWNKTSFTAKNSADHGGIYLPGQTDSGDWEDVLGTMERYDNYDYYNEATQGVSGHGMESSLAFASKPDWFGPLEWPPYEVSNPVGESASKTRIPAGYRYIYGVDPGATPLNPARAYGKSVFALGGLSF